MTNSESLLPRNKNRSPVRQKTQSSIHRWKKYNLQGISGTREQQQQQSNREQKIKKYKKYKNKKLIKTRTLEK